MTGVLDVLAFSFYRFFLMPVAFVLVRIFSFLGASKLKTMVQDRNQINWQPLPARPIWIHAASGEIEYAKSVIRELKTAYPQIPILVTYFSPSAKKLIQKFPGIDLALPLPWDRRSSVLHFLKLYQPRACLIARTDVWPEFSYQIRKQKIPALLFAATISDQSSRKGFFQTPLTRFALHCLNEIVCVSALDEENLRGMKVRTPIVVGGDTRFDQVIFRTQNPLPVKQSLQPVAETWVCGSTWPEDEEVLLPAWKAWSDLGKKIILAPHEIQSERLVNLEKNLKSQGLQSVRYSGIDSWGAEAVLIVDQIGVLHELYSWGTVAFVGGSFKSKIHSVMEPLSCGLPTLVGPYHKNNREALQFQHYHLGPNVMMVNLIQNANDAIQVAQEILKIPDRKKQILKKVHDHSGATQKIMAWIRREVLP